MRMRRYARVEVYSEGFRVVLGGGSEYVFENQDENLGASTIRDMLEDLDFDVDFEEDY
jgi:hypothetical protein